MYISNRLKYITKSLRDCEEKYGREPNSVSVLAVSKGQSTEKIAEAFLAGQRLFGENYLQEALEKMTFMEENFGRSPGFAELEWHFIGPIQSNKTKKIAEHFAWVHSIDDEKIARRLSEQRPKNLPPLNVCIEVNISDESSKSGVKRENVGSLISYCSSLPNILVRGLMAIPKPELDFDLQRTQFHLLAELYQQLRSQGIPLDTLSMGMSGDFEAAIAEGATLVRIGTAIFSQRR